jgi:hypothetical protein
MKTVTEHEIESPGEAKRQAREAFNDRVDHYALERGYSHSHLNRWTMLFALGC